MYSNCNLICNFHTHLYGTCRLSQYRCHIGGLLFALNGKHRLECRSAEASCTSQLCQWVISRNQSPKPVSELSFTKPQLDSKPSRATSIDFDPRHPHDRSMDMKYTLDQLKDLKKIFPNTGLYMYMHSCGEEQPMCHVYLILKKLLLHVIM